MEAAIQNQNVALLYASGNMFELLEGIESTQSISGHEEQAGGFGNVSRQHQVNRTGDVGLNAQHFAIVIFGPGAGGFQKRLAGVHRIVLDLSPGCHQSAQNKAVADTISGAKTDNRNLFAKGFG